MCRLEIEATMTAQLNQINNLAKKGLETVTLLKLCHKKGLGTVTLLRLCHTLEDCTAQDSTQALKRYRLSFD